MKPRFAITRPIFLLPLFLAVLCAVPRPACATLYVPHSILEYLRKADVV